jgi:hypothetical protein
MTLSARPYSDINLYPDASRDKDEITTGDSNLGLFDLAYDAMRDFIDLAQ